MTGAELAAALRNTALLVEQQVRIGDLELEITTGAVLRVLSSAAIRKRRQRGGTKAGQDPGQKRDQSVTGNAHDDRVPCPADLDLTDAQAGSLELAPGIERWAQRVMRGEFVAAELGDAAKRMTLAQWRKCLSKAMCSRWSDPRRRPKPAVPEASEPGAVPDMHPVAKARLARYTADREAAIAKAAAEHDAKGLAPVRDLRALTEGIGG